MTLSLEDLSGRVLLAREELETWIAEGWVRPLRADSTWVFAEVDVARVLLIREVRETFNVGPEAMPVFLSLVDQLHATRRDLRALMDALAGQPAEVRRRVLEVALGLAGD